MLGPDRLARITAAARVPEQVIPYVCAVSGSRPRLVGACVGYETERSFVLVGYPLHDPLDVSAMSIAVDEVLRMDGLRKITVIGAALPPQAPPDSKVMEDGYYSMALPAHPPGQKLRNLLRRAGRELDLQGGRRLERDHWETVRKYLNERNLAAGTRRILEHLPQYLEASDGSLVVSARRKDGRLAAFAVGEFSALEFAFFMFCFRDPATSPPGAADLVLSGLLEEARARGQTRMNLGLGVNEGIRFFKCKWGAEQFLPYVEVSWNL